VPLFHPIFEGFTDEADSIDVDVNVDGDVDGMEDIDDIDPGWDMDDDDSKPPRINRLRIKK